MKPRGLTIKGLARAMGGDKTRLWALIHGKRAVTIQTALMLGDHFEMDPRDWMMWQADFDLFKARMAQREAEAAESRKVV